MAKYVFDNVDECSYFLSVIATVHDTRLKKKMLTRYTKYVIAG